MSILTFGLGQSGSFEENAVRFADMREAKLLEKTLEADLEVSADLEADLEIGTIEASIETKVLTAELIRDEFEANIDC